MLLTFLGTVDINDKDVAEEIAGTVQDATFAFYSREEARARGVPVDRHVHSTRPKSELTLLERKKNVADLKRKTTCRVCGKKGHWVGDPEFA